MDSITAEPVQALSSLSTGDSRAFSQVYTAMCTRIGLESMIVTGTRDGAKHWWNLVNIDSSWYHVDLLGSRNFQPLTDDQMAGYDWDRTAYPAADGAAE